MDDRRVTLPDLATIRATQIEGYSLEAGGQTVTLWIDSSDDGNGPVRVFTSETDDAVYALVVPTPAPFPVGSCGGREFADVIARLQAPLGGRPVIDASTWRAVAPHKPGARDFLDPEPEWRAPRLRPIGSGSQNDPLTFRGEISERWLTDRQTPSEPGAQPW